MAYGRRRRGRRLVVALVVFVVLLAGLVVAADRVGRWAAQRAVADEVVAELTAREITSRRPEVAIGGFPFLTQVAAQRFDSVTIALRDVRSAELSVPELAVEATGVEGDLIALARGEGRAVARRIAGTAVLDWASTAALVGQPGLRLSAEDGTVRVHVPVRAFGQRFTLTGTARLTVVDGRIRVRVDDLGRPGQRLPPFAERLLADYRDQLATDLTLPPLPFGMKVRAVRPVPAGVEVTMAAENVPITG